MRLGDANTKYLHLMANLRKKKNCIQYLQTENGPAISKKCKHEVIYNHYLQHSGTYVHRTCSLNLHELGWEPAQLLHLELPFSGEEIKVVTMTAPKEKAPGPDGFIRIFFSSCWEIIKGEIIRAIQQFYLMNQQGLHFLNQSYVLLIPKRNDPQSIKDYMPISLTHSFVKIISKILANILAPELNKLISANYTAFIQKRAIHDNFIYVQQVITKLHHKKIPDVFIKLDIAKAFDTISLPYLLHIMSHLGFDQRWRNWISALWCTASSSYLLNGEPGKRVLHCKGVRQGDPLSPHVILIGNGTS
jgi:hypothetical protein